MKFSILLFSLFISAQTFAFDSYKSFPIEKMKQFTEMSASEQFSHLQSLNISLYKYSKIKKNDYNFRLNSQQIGIMSYLDEMPEELTEIIPYFNIWAGVFIASREFSVPNDTIVLGDDINIITFYHEVGHAYLEQEKIKSNAINQDYLLKNINEPSEKIEAALEKDKVDIETLRLLPSKLNWTMTYLREKTIEEAVVNHHLLNFLNLEEFSEQTLGRAVDYLTDTCDNVLTHLNQEVKFYAEITSKHQEMVDSSKDLKLAMKQTRVNFLETINFFDQVCIFNNENPVRAKYFDYYNRSIPKSYSTIRQIVLENYNKVPLSN